MPGAGFTTWDYAGLAEHFYKTYQYSDRITALEVFENIVAEIIALVEAEYTTGDLEKNGVWEWCTLKSGKQWPLSKWIQVNTVAPYKRARVMIRKS
jgi:hypothetical protein